MNRKRPTIKDVAAHAGVSIATVSNVFSGNKPVNADLRQRVERAARDLSYQVDRAASQLRSGQARVVCVLVPDLDDAFFTALVSRLEVLARKDGYDVIVASSRDDVELERSRLRALLGWRPSGLIAVPCSDAVPALLREEVGHLPMVFCDRVTPRGCFADTVTIDNVEAGEMVAHHLLDKGHADILIAASSLGISPIRDRVRGVRAVAERAGVATTVLETGSNAERGAEIVANWLERNPRPAAFFGLTNVTTLSVLSALARQGIEIPDEVSLVGFDDYAWMSARKTALTAIRQPIDEMASAAWERLRARMAGEQGQPRQTILNATLQMRRSVVRRGPALEGHGQAPVHAAERAVPADAAPGEKNR
jgi:LacI family transcriptional regulator